jgi:hypothetical protein
LPASAETFSEKSRWAFFWVQCYISSHGDSGSQNYIQAWRDKYLNASFVMFVDNKHRLDVPCSATMDDKDFLEHVRDFYHLIRAEKGIMEVLGAMTLARIEVIKVETWKLGSLNKLLII